MCRLRLLPIIGTSGATYSFNSFWLELVKVFILPSSVLSCPRKLKNPAVHARVDGAAVWGEIDRKGNLSVRAGAMEIMGTGLSRGAPGVPAVEEDSLCVCLAEREFVSLDLTGDRKIT